MIENIQDNEENKSLNFVEQIVKTDLEEGKNNGRLQTRFPPEPNGYLHIGHAKAICMDFGIAEKFGGVCNLRFDDTNPTKEDVEYVDSIKEDIEWLGFKWGKICYASDYFEDLYNFAISLIKKGLAYVDDQTAEEIAKQKGTPTTSGIDSPFRNRSVEENLDLFKKMKDGEFDEGSHVLRAKIDMANANMHFRDPLLYRIVKIKHHRTGNKWNIYPLYDFAHGQSDYFEGVTHSICTLEFEVHRPLYNYFVNLLKKDDYCPRQIEFNRLNITYMVMSKRKMLELVKEGYVSGWDDPRMPTISGLRRRGYTPEAIRDFISRIGYTKFDGVIDISLLEHSVRQDLRLKAPRINAVFEPLELIVTNFPDGEKEMIEVVNNPDNEELGKRVVSFSKKLYIEKKDFMENAPRKFYRMSQGREVRLKNAYVVKCTSCEKDEEGNVNRVYCEYIPNTRQGQSDSNRKVKATIQYVNQDDCVNAEVREYDRLLTVEKPSEEKEKSFLEMINPDSLKVKENVKIETFVANAKPLSHFQFQRVGYFCVDKESTDSKIIFNSTVSLKESKAKKDSRV